MPDTSSFSILVVDDDADTCSNLRDILELDGYTIETANTATQALRRRDWTRFGSIILDRKLPDGLAEEVLPRFRKLAPHAAIVIVTGFGDLDSAIAALRQGAADFILKPINADLIRNRLAHIAARRKAEDEIVHLNADLQRRNSELETLLHVIPIGIAIAQDAACQNIRVNPSLARLLQIAESANASLSAALPERPAFRVFSAGRELAAEELPMQVAAGAGCEVRDTEVDVLLADQRTIHLLGHAAPLLDEHGRPRGAVGAFIDITERKRQQERLLQSERLAAIGQMMTGLAHESGNALARSQACLEMLSWEVESRPEALDLISRIQKALDHLKQLYEDVRGYAAPLKLEREAWDLRGVWNQAWQNLAMLRQHRDVLLTEAEPHADLTCSIDAFRLEQVFRNIFENALAACRDPVRITVRTTETALEGHPALALSVQDNGPGFTADQARRIFEPFFTTKAKGTGLGMAIAQRIVEAHGGRIAVGPATGGGAEIVLTLPRDNA